MVDRLYATGEMEAEAVSAIEELKQAEKEVRDNLANQTMQEQQQRELSQKQFRNDLSQVIEQANYIESARKNKVKSFLFNLSGTNDNVSTQFDRVLLSISSNKEHLTQLADILLDYDLNKGFNMERFYKKGSSQATKGLRDKLEDLSSNTKTKVTGTTSKVHENQFDWEEFLRQS